MDTMEVDFKKYRTPELFAAVSELIDWRGTFGSGLRQAITATVTIGALVGVGLFAATWLWTPIHRQYLLVMALVLLMCIPGGFPAGLFYSIAHFIRSSLTNMLLIVDLLLETTKTVAKDINSIRSGNAAMPSAKRLVQGVYLEVFLPIMEKVISDRLWIFAKPTLFVYRLTFGRLIRLVIRLLPGEVLVGRAESGEQVDLQAVADGITDKLSTIADRESQIVGALGWTQGQLKHQGARARAVVMIPCYLISGRSSSRTSWEWFWFGG